MNKTQQLLKEREELFDKEFGEIAFWNQKTHKYELQKTAKHYKRSKSFHATTISLVLNSLKEEVDEKIKEALGKTDVADAVENINAFKGKNLSHRAILEVLYLGHFQALDKFSTLLSETISNIQTK